VRPDRPVTGTDRWGLRLGLAVLASAVCGTVLFSSGWVQNYARCLGGCEVSGWALPLTVFVMPVLVTASLVWIVAASERKLPRGAASIIGFATLGIVVAGIAGFSDSPDPDRSQNVGFIIMEGIAFVWPVLFGAGAFTAMAYEAARRRRRDASAPGPTGTGGSSLAIPAPPIVSDRRIQAYLGTGFAIFVGVTLVGTLGDRSECAGDRCVPFAILMLTLPILAVALGSAVIARRRGALSARERWVLAASGWIGVGSAMVIVGMLEGGTVGGGLGASVMVGVLVVPTLWFVSTLTSWGFEVRRAFGRRRTPARPDTGELG